MSCVVVDVVAVAVVGVVIIKARQGMSEHAAYGEVGLLLGHVLQSDVADRQIGVPTMRSTWSGPNSGGAATSDMVTCRRNGVTSPYEAVVQTILATSSVLLTTANHHHRHVDNGHDEEGEDSRSTRLRVASPV